MGKKNMDQFEALHQVEQNGLRIYMDWLNEWSRINDGEQGYQVSLGEFFSDHWEETKHLDHVKIGWYDLWIMEAGTGDDGGPAVLYIWAIGDESPVRQDPSEKRHIEAVVQEFDTSFFEVYNHEHGGLIHQLVGKKED